MLNPEVTQWWNQSSLAYVKRAIEIAANGKHNILLIGEPSNGKTAMLKVLAELQNTHLENDTSRVWMDEVVWINSASVMSRHKALELADCRMQIAVETHLCPCGYYGSKYHACTCTPRQISAFQRRFHPSFMGAIAMHIVMNDRDAQDRGKFPYNGDNFEAVKARMIPEWRELPVSAEAQQLYDIVWKRMMLSARAALAMKKVANTIALMDIASGSSYDNIMIHHMAEAAQYRGKATNYIELTY